MQEDSFYPRGVCVDCLSAVMQCLDLINLVKTSNEFWLNSITALSQLPEVVSPSVKSLYAFVKDADLHLLRNTVPAPSSNDFSPNLPQKSFVKRKKSLSSRKPRVPKNGPSCTCTDCGKQFTSPFYLSAHLQNSSEKDACLVCGAVANRGLAMQGHMLTSHGQSTALCADCPLLFASKEDLQKHRKTAHRSGSFTCNHCGRVFPRQSTFETHFQMHAVRICRTCGVQFTNRGCYREHRSQCEPEAKPNLKLLKRHMRSNIRDPANYICDYCGKVYQSRPQLKNHIIWIHMNVRPHQCQWCGKRFYTSARLAEHSVVHTRERKFSCDICGAKLVTKMAMVYHRRRHTGEKPYECEDCGEKFISSSRRSEHAKRRHGKGTMFQCQMCNGSFVRRLELKKHVEKIHKSVTTIIDIKSIKEVFHDGSWKINTI